MTSTPPTKPSRAPAGAGTVTPLPSGKHRVRVTTADGRRVQLGIFTSDAEAREVLDAFLLKAAEAGVAPTGGVTLRAYGTHFLVKRAEQVRSVDIDRNRWNAHIATAFFADWPIADITARDVRRWRDELRVKRATRPAKGGTKKSPKRVRTNRKLSRLSVKNTLNLLRRAFALACEEDLIETNPALGIEVHREARVEDPWTYLTPEELDALRAVPMPTADLALILFALGTGLRKGELEALKLGDVHPEAEHPHVVVRFGSPGKPTKSGRIRRVPLFGLGLEACRLWLRERPTYIHVPKRRAGEPKDSVLFAPTRRGNCRYQRRFRTTIDGRPAQWPDVVRAAGIERRVRWHDLRHSCASFLVAGWWGRRWSLEEVKEMLGHSSIQVTERYAHLAESALQRAARETSARRSREGHEEDPTDDE